MSNNGPTPLHVTYRADADLVLRVLRTAAATDPLLAAQLNAAQWKAAAITKEAERAALAATSTPSATDEEVVPSD